MTPEDKEKLQKAWRKAVNNDPNADKPVKGIISKDGTPMTPRELVEASLAAEEFYQVIDKMLKDNPMTVDQFIKRNFEKPAPKSSGPKS